MNTTGARIRQAREKIGLRQVALAKAVGVSNVTISNWESDNHALKADNAAKLASVLRVSVNYLLYGTDGTTDEMDDNSTPGNQLPNGFGQANTEAGPEIRDNRVPVIGEATAGAFRHIEQLRPDEIEEYVASMKNQDGYRFALRIVGQSMENPGGKKHIPDGSIVIFNARRTDPETGDLVLAKLLFGEETTFKKFVRDAGKVWLEPLNPRYPMITEQFQVIATAEEMVQIL